jgi:small-conductance mechanosensitive channel
MNELAQDTLERVVHLVELLKDPRQWWQVLALVVVFGLAWLAARGLRRSLLPRLEGRSAGGAELGRVALERWILPALGALGTLIAAAVLSAAELPHALLRIATILAASLVAVRVVVYLLKHVLKPGPLLEASEHAITWAIWTLVAFALLGWLEPVRDALDTVAFTVGSARFSLLDATSAILTLLVFVLTAAYVGALLESRLMAASEISIGLRVGIAKTVRFGLIILAALLAFNVVGFDLGGLTVFSGALGVGIGFGLQRIASNFVSGFILIGDRSIRPGDVITIDERFGVVRELRARYIVVRDRDGVDTLIPNETIITSQVINWSYADRAIRLKLAVQISYEDNPREAMQLLLEAARSHPRVEPAPEPAARVMGFGESGIDLELRYWIRDPEDGINNVRSDLYLAIWDAFRAAGITIPYPQRDVHLRAASAPADGPSTDR